MPDISKCEGGDCPLKNKCYRYISADSMQQSYFVDPPYIGDDCDFFWGFDIDNDLKEIYEYE